MPRSAGNLQAPDRATSILMWDMAGTLVPYDPLSGKAGPLPGWTDFLPELDREFRQVVTTGDSTETARNVLQDLEMLPQFEEVFGNLSGPGGKPYGVILRHLGGRAQDSLVVGDTLPADLPADTDKLVTILINQNGQRHNAGKVAFLVHILRKQLAPSFPEAFDRLVQGALRQPQPARGNPGPSWALTEAFLRNDGFDYRLCLFTHPLLPGKRRVIVL